MGVGMSKSDTGHWLGIVLISCMLLNGCIIDNSGGIAAGPTLTITTLDNPVSKNALQNVEVIMYDAADVKEADSGKTNSKGEVVLHPGINNSWATHVDISVYYLDPATNKHKIETFFGLVPGTYTVYLASDRCRTNDNINVTVNAASSSASKVLLSPYGSGAPGTANTGSISNNAATLSSVNICNTSLQSDGTYSPLVLANDNNGLVDYGYMLNQGFSSGDTYAITLDQKPDTLNWTSDNPLGNVTYFALRQNALYLGLGSWNTTDTSTGAKSGNISVADKFPADLYGYAASTVADVQNNNVKSTLRRTANFNPSETINFTINQFSDFSYDSLRNTFSWTLAGTDPKDVIAINTHLGADINWTLYTTPTAVDYGSISITGSSFGTTVSPTSIGKTGAGDLIWTSADNTTISIQFSPSDPTVLSAVTVTAQGNNPWTISDPAGVSGVTISGISVIFANVVLNSTDGSEVTISGTVTSSGKGKLVRPYLPQEWNPSDEKIDEQNTYIQEKDVTDAGIDGYFAYMQNLVVSSGFDFLEFSGLDEIKKNLDNSQTTTSNYNSNNNGNSSSNTGNTSGTYGSLTLSGDVSLGVSLSPTSGSVGTNGNITWTTADSVSISVQPSASDATKATAVTLSGQGITPWTIGNQGGLSGVSITGNSVTFTSLTLSPATGTNSGINDITVNGTLTY